MSQFKTVNGTVARITSKEHNGSVAYSLLVNEGGAENWYSAGFAPPACQQGQQVTFAATSREFNGRTYWNLQKGSLQVAGGAPAPAPAQAAPAQAAAPAGSPAPSFKDKQIIAQSSLRTATQAVGAMLDAGVLPVGSGSKAAKYDLVKGYIFQLGREIAEACLDPELLLSAPAEAEPPASPEAPDGFVAPVE
jgi:hypothetical protein